MHTQNDQLTAKYSIIGMNLISEDYPGLKTFKHFLLTGHSNNGVAKKRLFLKTPAQMFTDTENKLNNGRSILENKLICGMKGVFIDASLTGSKSKNMATSVVIQHIEKSDENLSGIDQIVNQSMGVICEQAGFLGSLTETCIIGGNLSEGIKKSIELLDMNPDSLCLLTSIFPHTNGHLKPVESVEENHENESGKEKSLVLGCILLSNQTLDESSYAEINWGESEEESLKRKAGNQNHTTIVNLIQAALSLNNRTVFINESTSADGEKQISNNRQYLVKPWFQLPFTEKNEIEIPLTKKGNTKRYLTLEKDNLSKHHPRNPFYELGFYLLPIGFDNVAQGLEKIDIARTSISVNDNLEGLIYETLVNFSSQRNFNYFLTVLGSTAEEITSELDRARESLPKIMDSGKDWQTPVGSYFTPNPMGPKEKIAFMYPGAFGTYIGMGSEIFYLFPQLHEAILTLTDDPGTAINEHVIFPQVNSSDEIENLQKELDRSPTMMISSGIFFSYLFTVILRDILKVKPDATFGYSLGENSMMFATGIWTQADAMRTSLEASPLFHDRVSGKQNAIREFWKTSKNDEDTSIWTNYVLMASYDKVKEAIKKDDRVYITHINTPRQVVIGGDNATCQRIADSIKCMYLRAPYDHAIHCEPVFSEFDAFTHLHHWPVENKPGIPVFSAADYAPLTLDSRSIATSFAKMLTHPIDFPRLVKTAYEDGARTFIELGAGSNCSKWVDAILKDKPHAAMTINQNNASDHVSILRLLARLISHRIPADLGILTGNY